MTTIVVGSLLGGIVAYFILKRYEKYEQINFKTMETLRETSDFNLSLVKAIPFGMDIVDLKGNILFVSERLQTILGRDVVGEKCWDIYHDKKEQCNLCPLRHRDMNHGTGTVEVDGVFGGRSFQISHVSMIYKGEQAVLEVFNDITERKRAERDLAKSRDFYLTLFEEFPGLIWRSGLDAKCNYFNKTWLDFTGRTFEQEYGFGWAEGVHPDDLDRCIEIYLGSFKKQQKFEMDYRLKRYDGQYRWINDRGIPFFDKEGNFTGFIGSCMDITEKIEGQRLKEMAQNDSLCNTYNRQYSYQLLSDLFDQDGKAAFLSAF
jgi:PAS domain S-box-containing protein